MEHLFNNDTKPSDEWINENFYLYIKDNTPTEKVSYSLRKQACEFCGRRHSIKDDYCEVKTSTHEDANKFEAA